MVGYSDFQVYYHMQFSPGSLYNYLSILQDHFPHFTPLQAMRFHTHNRAARFIQHSSRAALGHNIL